MQDFSIYFGLGWNHIISIDALDHLLFLVALAAIYRLENWRGVLLLVTAFTIGHFLTLFLSVLNLIRADAQWVEFLIPLTIVVTASANLLRKDFRPESLSINYALALCFGLVHGLGYANAIRFMLVGEQSLGWSLFAFNLGLEIGQIVVVLMVLIIGGLMLRIMHNGQRIWVIIISAIVLLVSVQMLIDRIPKF